MSQYSLEDRIIQLEAKLAKVQEWLNCLNEWEGQYDVDASELQELKNILGDDKK